MWIEIVVVVLVTGLVFIALGSLLNEEGPIEPDGDDDLGPVRPIFQVLGSLVSLVVSVVLLAIFEAARLALRARARKRSAPPH